MCAYGQLLKLGWGVFEWKLCLAVTRDAGFSADVAVMQWRRCHESFTSLGGEKRPVRNLLLKSVLLDAVRNAAGNGARSKRGGVSFMASGQLCLTQKQNGIFVNILTFSIRYVCRYQIRQLIMLQVVPSRWRWLGNNIFAHFSPFPYEAILSAAIPHSWNLWHNTSH